LTNYIDAYEKADIIVFLVAHKEFLDLEPKAGELDFCGIRK
jgi:UDP-N-acetyl-D-mannosaminuronic acid dehydrogenase